MTITAEQLAAVKQPKKPAPKRKAVAKKKAPVKPVTKATFTDTMFAHALIQNQLNPGKAYKQLKPHVTNNTAGVEGRKHLRKPSFIAILTPMLQALFTEAGVTTEWVMRRWTEMSQATPLDYFRIDDDGDMHLRSTEVLTEAQRLNLRKIKVTKNETQSKDGERLFVTTRTEVEVVDQQKAVSEIAKHLGLLVEKLDDDAVDRIGDLIEQGVARIRASKDLDGWKSITLEGELDRA